jgi:hypothetical protein
LRHVLETRVHEEPVMLSPLHDLFRHHPAYNFGRFEPPSHLHRRRWSELDEFEELKRRKFVRDQYEEEWRRFGRGPATLVGELAAALLVLFAVWGSVTILRGGHPDQLAGKQPESLAAAADLTSR